MKKILALIALAIPFTLTSCLKDQIYGGVTFDSITATVAYSETDNVTVTAKVTSLVEIQQMVLSYVTGTFAVKTVDMVPANNNEYKAVIPGQPKGERVTYYIEATTASGKFVSPEKSYVVGEAKIDYSGLKLNELNGNDKFIEIVNTGADIPTMNGVRIQKDGADVWTGGSIELKSGAYLLLYSVDVKGAHPEHPEALFFDSGLSAKKAVRVQMFSPEGTSLSDFNYVTYSGTPAKASYGVNTDGKWYYQDVATPGAANENGNVPVTGLEGDPEPEKPAHVFLSELNGNDKFIEIANDGGKSASLKGFKIQKDGTDVWTAADDLVIEKGGFVLLYSTDVKADHEGHPETLFFTSGLSAKKAVRVQLFNGTESVSDFNYVKYSGTPAKASYGVNTDGKWYYQDTATPGAANVNGTVLVTGLE